MIRDANENELKSVAELYKQTFPHHFILKLGEKLFLKYLQYYLTNNYNNIFLVSGTKKIEGILIGTSQYSFIKKTFIRKNLFIIIIRILFLIIRLDKDVWNKIWKFFLKSRKKQRRIYNFDFKPILLLILCVSHDYKGKGLSQHLIKTFEERIIGMGYEGYILSVKKNNRRAISFYNKVSMLIYGETDTDLLYFKQLFKKI